MERRLSAAIPVFAERRPMAGRGPQSFKKRQKEQQRKEKQMEKAARKLERKRNPQDPSEEPPDDTMDLELPLSHAENE
ncbi:MAG TPA: hypothetical protein VNX18_09920 [Bryobacteraceae bacterium]|jgi:hypothetical protein|nr:hypothetical protein [Bryobacteraceae bacterium]